MGLTRNIFIVTLAIEALGGLLLSLKFVPQFGWAREYTTVYFTLCWPFVMLDLILWAIFLVLVLILETYILI